MQLTPKGGDERGTTGMQSLRPVLQFAGRVAPAPTGLHRTIEAKKLTTLFGRQRRSRGKVMSEGVALWPMGIPSNANRRVCVLDC